MTKAEAITELVRIWHSPHLDLSLKAGLAEVIETLKEKNQSDSLVTDSSDACKENKSKLDLVRRQAVLDALEESGYCYRFWIDIENVINSLPSAEPKTDGVLEQIRWERDVALKTLEEHGIGFAEEPKTGEWIFNTSTSNGKSWNVCSECGESIFHPTNFCPNCGADMRGEKHE